MNITNCLSSLESCVSQTLVCILRKPNLIGLRQEVHYHDLLFFFRLSSFLFALVIIQINKNVMKYHTNNDSHIGKFILLIICNDQLHSCQAFLCSFKHSKYMLNINSNVR